MAFLFIQLQKHGGVKKMSEKRLNFTSVKKENAKKLTSAEIKDHTAEFLKNGGKIRVYEQGDSSTNYAKKKGFR